MHLIAIHGLAANELTFPLFIPLDGFDLLGNVFGIHIVHNGTERGNVIGGGFYTGVNYRNSAHRKVSAIFHTPECCSETLIRCSSFSAIVSM